MTYPSIRIASGILALSLLSAQSMPVFAQDALMQTQMAAQADNGTEQLTLVVGDILEILPSHTIQSPAYSWILTQDRTFLQAARTSTFRYRFIQPGTYSLIGEITSADGQTRVLRTFVITAKARTPGNVAVGTSSSAATGDSALTGLVKIDPPMDTNQRVILRENQQLLKLSPLTQELKPLSLDLDASKDTDNDGNATNDVENQGTFFQLYAEPLSIWFADPITTRTLTVVTVGSDGSARTQSIETVTTSYAQQQNIVVSPIRITSTQTGNGSVSFSAVAGDSTPQSTSLLYRWTFGDGQESLIVNPEHVYAADGTYTVTLQVKNLIDGQDVATDTQEVIIQGAGALPSSAASSTATSGAGSSFLSGLPLMSILIGLGVFALFVALGMGVVFLFGKMRGGKSLDQTFADMEKTIIAKEDSNKAPPALIIPATATQTPKPAIPAAAAAPVAPPTREDLSVREENAASAAPVAATPRIDTNAAPDWLKKGLDPSPKSAPAAAPVSPAPTPTPATPPAPKPAPTPAPMPPPPAATTASTAPTAPVPSWLQTPAAPAPLPPKPAPVPAPVQSPAPVPSKPPVTTPPVVAAAPMPTATATPAPAPAQPPVTPSTPVTPPFKPAPAPVPTPATSPVAPPAPKPTPISTPAPAPVKPPVPQPVIKPTPAATPTPPATSPATPPLPKPTPQQTPQTVAPKPPVSVTPPIPTPAPKPVVPPAPRPTPPVAAPTMPTQAPLASPAPVAPRPVPTPPKPVSPTPASPLPPTPATPVAPAKPAQTPAPQQPAPEIKTPVPSVAPATPIQNPPPTPVDTPIAIIRAESLDRPQGEQS